VQVDSSHNFHGGSPVGGAATAEFQKIVDVMDEQLWKATWRQSGRSFSVALVDHPKIRATARTLDEAIGKLEDRIADVLGDAVPHLEFVRALPTGIGRANDPAFLFTLAAHNRIEGIKNLEALFDRPRCAECGNICGSRTREPICLSKPPKDHLSFTEFLGQIVSSRLAQFLKLQHLNEVKLLPTLIGDQKSEEFLEVLSVHPRPYVARDGVKASQAFRCGKCGATVLMYMPYEAEFLKYIAVDSLPTGDVPVFPVGVGHEARLAVNRAVRDAVIRSRTFKNVVSSKVGVLPKEQSISLDEYFGKSARRKKGG
jgi:hypothetical protein